MYWVLDTVDLRWTALKSLMEKSRFRASIIEKCGWVPLNGECSLSTARVPASKVPRKLADHVQLWKGVDEDSVVDLLFPEGMCSTGTIFRSHTLLTESPNDFNGAISGYCFVTDTQTGSNSDLQHPLESSSASSFPRA